MGFLYIYFDKKLSVQNGYCPSPEFPFSPFPTSSGKALGVGGDNFEYNTQEAYYRTKENSRLSRLIKRNSSYLMWT